MSEAAIENNNVSWALRVYGDAMKKRTGKLLCRKMNGMGARSWPDRLFIALKRTWFIEYKKPGKVPEPLQERMIAALRLLGFPVFVVDNREEGRRIIREMMEHGWVEGYDADGSPA